jgi:hypothetical protein
MSKLKTIDHRITPAFCILQPRNESFARIFSPFHPQTAEKIDIFGLHNELPRGFFRNEGVLRGDEAELGPGEITLNGYELAAMYVREC